MQLSGKDLWVLQANEAFRISGADVPADPYFREASMRQRFGCRLVGLYRRHSKLFKVIAIFLAAWVGIAWASSFLPAFSPRVLLSRDNAEALKQHILGFGVEAPALFVGLQVLQVVAAPIPGQAAGFAGGYVFGWRKGLLFTMIGLTLGSWLVFLLSRKLGRGFVERLNGAEAMKEFEALFIKEQDKEKNLYGKSKRVVCAHGLLTFFIVMLLPGLPDDLVCFVAGLSGIPIWQLMIATLVGRFPGMLVLSLAGDGFSKAQSNTVSIIFIAVTLALTAAWFCSRQRIERIMRRAAGVPPAK